MTGTSLACCSTWSRINGTDWMSFLGHIWTSPPLMTRCECLLAWRVGKGWLPISQGRRTSSFQQPIAPISVDWCPIYLPWEVCWWNTLALDISYFLLLQTRWCCHHPWTPYHQHRLTTTRLMFLHLGHQPLILKNAIDTSNFAILYFWLQFNLIEMKNTWAIIIVCIGDIAEEAMGHFHFLAWQERCFHFSWRFLQKILRGGKCCRNYQPLLLPLTLQRLNQSL